MLNRAAIRLCSVFALKGRTFAGDGVRDSEITAIDPGSLDGEKRPYIAVYTDDQSDGSLELSFEIGVTARMTVQDADGNDVIIEGVPPTDAGIEITLDLVERQIYTALKDEGNAWSELLRVAYTGWAENGKSVRGASKTADGERYAGRQIILTGTPLSDPEFARPVSESSFWQRFLNMADQEPALSAIAKLMREALGEGQPVDSNALERRAMNLSHEAARTLGIMPEIAETEAMIADAQVDTEAPGSA